MRYSPVLLGLLFASAGCVSEYAVANNATTHVHAETATTGVMSYTAGYTPGYGGTIPVLQSRHLDRATEVIKILDIHVPVGGQDAALAELQAQAAAVGADAVVGAEFHHGEGNGEPIHVSGMAVRFIELPPY